VPTSSRLRPLLRLLAGSCGVSGGIQRVLGESVQDLDLVGISFGRYKQLAEWQSSIDCATYPWLVVWLTWLWIWAWSFRFRYFAMEILAECKVRATSRRWLSHHIFHVVDSLNRREPLGPNLISLLTLLSILIYTISKYKSLLLILCFPS
jgi:hypothetical protein